MVGAGTLSWNTTRQDTETTTVIHQVYWEILFIKIDENRISLPLHDESVMLSIPRSWLA